ncbi:substrate-binding and VWA domain-containing protein [Actinorugispora endophytica]|uniref:von Willebrand factor type A domain-containing protein n=1 Tax=Actinorugispora endophytica TaxID=1605990 RepID=A0A4R6USN8_9ACTN|nr:substrate-binding and VWA domain-containing protein [Actinorugispora endophytica]TDQ49276.1 von Willebrand factor type A domain-containing protein [Actinorugispora endophytica]
MGRHRGNSADANDSTAPDDYEPRRRASRKRRRGKRRALVAFAAALAVLTGLGVTGYLVLGGRGGCGGQDIPLSVAAAPEIAPVLTRVAQTFNDENEGVDGQCVNVEVRGVDSADVAYGITGAGPTMGDTDSDVWIPDSGIWPSMVRRDSGDAVVTDTGTSVARSPLVLAMPEGAAADAEEAGEPPSWQTLVPTQAPSSTTDAPYQVRVVDPVRSASGLATLALLSGAIGTEDEDQPQLIAALQNLQESVSADEEAAFGVLSDTEEGSRPVLVLSEQAAWRYNSRHPDSAAHVTYPEGGTYTLDYPYVLRTTDPLTLRAAEAFRDALTRQAPQESIRAEGFRSADGRTDPAVLGEDAGFRAEAPENLPTPSDSSVKSLTSAWNQLRLGTRLLTVVDISGSMIEPVPGTGLTRMQVTTMAAREGLDMFKKDSELGIWEFSVRINNDLDYRETVPIRALDAEVDGTTQHQVLDSALAGIQPKPDGDTGLYDTILAAYREMSGTYAADRVNTILVLTDGNNDDDASISLEELLSTLQAEAAPDRPVAVISIAFGPDVDPEPLERIAEATNGAAYTTDDPTRIGEIFLESFTLRITEDEE